jgi:hypothetical protein
MVGLTLTFQLAEKTTDSNENGIFSVTGCLASCSLKKFRTRFILADDDINDYGHPVFAIQLAYMTGNHECEAQERNMKCI